MNNHLPTYRRQQGMSQHDLARRLGVSRQTIISIEKGKYNPSLPLALHLARIFETEVEQLFQLEEKDIKS